jgi:tetratricopeptide (TPR) repeat protein
MSSSNLVDLMAKANTAHAQGRLDDCGRICRAILEIQPGAVPALVLAGVVAAKKEETEAAVSLFQMAILHDPQCTPAYLWLSMAHRRLGQKQHALAQAKEAVARNPNDALSVHHLGLCFLDLEDCRSAEARFAKAISMAPNVALVHFGMGLALQGLKRNAEAIGAFRRAERLDPSSVATLIALRQILMEEGDSAGAVLVAREILGIQPRSAEANFWLARVLMEDNKATEADDFLRRGMELEADSALAHLSLGSAFQVKGKLEEADAHFRRSIELLPEQGSAYLALATNQRFKDQDRPIVDKMEALLHAGGLTPTEHSELHYALGKALEDLGEYRGAMEHFDEANRITYEIKFGKQAYDSRDQDGFDRLAQSLAPVLFEQNRNDGTSSELPIFVVGMIRSGTTLVEQILSSHPLVGAAGEQRFWLESGGLALSAGGKLDVSMLARLAGRYEKLLQGIAPGKDRVVDKMPMNYQALGLIHLAFPRAKIIHIRRHPVDTCLSIYATPNRNRLGWAHDKGNIASAYERYLRTMDHWKSVLPADALMEVRYEQIVTEPETTIRSMIEFCRLEWNDDCLHHENNARTVNTPSVWQVRQPVYRSSLERWKRFEPWLGPFARLG